MARLSNTAQIKDLVTIAQQQRMTLQLWIRKGTHLSKPLLAEIKRLGIDIQYLDNVAK